MATQEDYENLVSLDSQYQDFKITLHDLPTTEGRFEHYLAEQNIPIKNLRVILVLLLFLIPVSTVGFFVMSYRTLDYPEPVTQEKSLLKTSQKS